MDRAINKSTNELVSSFEIYHNGSYQNLNKGEWIAPQDSITNWDELEQQKITEIPVHYVSFKEWIKKDDGTSVWCSPCFAIYPDSPVGYFYGCSNYPDCKHIVKVA